ncbi:MAG: hypothetical protein COB04_16180 [Gammaproteobacteria bacterium]|nr:MAG: hypothetical protein COB04_16180 [Gammaproteobacteria bacterium]
MTDAASEIDRGIPIRGAAETSVRIAEFFLERLPDGGKDARLLQPVHFHVGSVFHRIVEKG